MKSVESVQEVRRPCRSLGPVGRMAAACAIMMTFTACIGPHKPVPTQRTQEAAAHPAETPEPSPAPDAASAEAPPSGVPPVPLPVPPMAEAPTQASTPTSSDVPVVDVKPVYVVAQHESYKVDRTTTAARTDTPIMETPYSVQVVPQQILRDQQAVRLETALQNVSGVTRFDGSIDGQDGYLIRGFETTAHYRNGVLRPNNHLVDTANIERVEVLKGPASILYGRADPGGIVNIVTKQPQATPYYSIQQQIGSYGFYRTTADATGRLSKDETVLYRFNFGYENSGSFRDFVNRNSTFLAPVVQWKISPRTQITAEFEYQRVSATGDGKIPALGNRPAPIPISRYLDEPAFSLSRDERYFAGINWSHEFNDDWKVVHRLSAEFVHGLGYQGVVPTAAALEDGTVDRYIYNTPPGSQTNRYQSSLNLIGHVMTGSIKHTLLFGYDYFYESDKFGAGNCCQSLPINMFNPVYLAGPPTLDPAFNQSPASSSRSWHGFYAQDQVTLPFNLHLLAGFRYDDAVGRDRTLNEKTQSDHRLSPRVGLVWQARPWLSLYGSYTENFGVSNGFNTDRQPLPPQTAQQWETGVKTEFFEGRLRATASYFQLTKQNLAVPDPTNPLFLKALGEAETRGFEFDVSGEILPGWSMIATYTYLPFAKITKDFADDGLGGTTPGNTGNRLFNAAQDMGSLWTTYAFQDETLRGLRFGAGVVAVGERQGDAANTFQMPGYPVANMMASYEWRIGLTRMTAQLNVNNIFDRTYYSSALFPGFITPGMPRFFMGSIRMEF